MVCSLLRGFIQRDTHPLAASRLWGVFPGCGVFSEAVGWHRTGSRAGRAPGMGQAAGGGAAAAAAAEGTDCLRQDLRAAGAVPGSLWLGDNWRGQVVLPRTAQSRLPQHFKLIFSPPFPPERSLQCPFGRAWLLPSAPGGSGTINPINSSAASSGRPTAPPSPSFLAICHSQFWCGARS